MVWFEWYSLTSRIQHGTFSTVQISKRNEEMHYSVLGLAVTRVVVS